MRSEAMPRRTIVVLSVVVAALALGACGGGSSNQAASSGGSGGGGGAGNAKQAEALIKQTFGANPKATSGKIDATIDITVKGVPKFRDPVSLTTTGPFSAVAGSTLTDTDFSLGLEMGPKAYGAGLTTSNDKAYLNLGSTAYALPASIVATMRQAAHNAGNALTKTVAPFYIHPELWERNPVVVGNENLAGVDVVHVSADINAAQLFLSASRFTRILTRLNVTGISGLPRAIGPAAQKALVRSVKTAHGDIYTGASDHVLRRAQLKMTLAVAPADRKVLGGITSATVAARLDVTDVGSPQKITVFKNHRPYAEAVGLLKLQAK